MVMVSSTRRLVDVDRLEAPFERGILLDVLAILVERRRADRVEFAARQHRLQHVAGVHRAFRRARADHRVQFVDEHHHVFGVGDFLEHGLQALFKLAAIFRARHQRAEIERNQPLVLQPFRHVAAHDALRQSFDDGRLAHTRFADEHRIVLGAARENLHHAANFVVAANHRIEFALPRQLRQIAPVFFQRLKRAFGILRGDARRSAHGHQRLQDRVGVEAARREQIADRGVRFRQRQQNMLGADVLIAHRLGFVLGSTPARRSRHGSSRSARWNRTHAVER